MRHAPRSPRSASVFQDLAQRLREVVRDEHRNGLSGAERFTVTSTVPLIIEQLAGDVILEDGDPDVTIGGWMRQYIANYGLRLGDQVWCLREGMEWHVVDVADPGGQTPWMT